MTLNKNISLKEIASETGYSIATISRVINNQNNVSDKARTIVTDKLLEHGYKLDFTKKQDTSKTLVILKPDYSNPFYSEILKGIEDNATIHGITCLEIKTNLSEQKTTQYFLNLLSDINVLGIISLSPFKNIKVAHELNQQHPLVMCSNFFNDPTLSSVFIDDFQAAYTATKYLLNLGCRHLLHINSVYNNSYAAARFKGFKKACLDMKDQKINYSELRLSSIDFHIALSQLMHVFKQAENKYDGVFASSDVFAAAAIVAAQKRHIKVPEELAVIGFDDIELSVIIQPNITTVQQPRYRIGFQACEILLEKALSKKEIEKQIVLPTQLIIRETT